MNRNLTMLSAVVLALPIAVEAPYDTSGHVTRISVSGGIGDYATIIRGCDRSVLDTYPIGFREVGADVEQQVTGPLHVGVRGGTVREEIASSDLGSYVRVGRYVNPYISLKSRSVGLGLGPIFSNESLPGDEPRFSGHLRFGGRKTYFSTSLMENVPLASGGGYFDLGVGFAPSARSDWWIGLSGGPFDGPGAAFKSSWHLSPRWTIDASGRLGYSGGENQSGIGVGITSRFGLPAGQPPGPGPATTSRSSSTTRPRRPARRGSIRVPRPRRSGPGRRTERACEATTSGKLGPAPSTQPGCAPDRLGGGALRDMWSLPPRLRYPSSANVSNMRIPPTAEAPVPDLPVHPTAAMLQALRAVLCQLAEPTTVLAAILQQSVTCTGADRGLFAEVLDDGGLEYRVLHGFQAKHFEGDAMAFSHHLFKRVVQTGEAVLLERAADDPYFGDIPSVRSLQTAAILCQPIHSGDRVAALVYLENRRPGHFREEHRRLLSALLEVAAPVLDALQAGRNVIHERDRLRASEHRLRQEAEESRALLARDWSFGRFVGHSWLVGELEAVIHRASTTDFPVLLLGEPGTGKSILARVLHYAGRRANRPLVTVFCPSFEKGMVEAELFGHQRGGFTGAMADRAGKVQAADGGTLFLDEIGELPLEIQPKLLRFLQEKTFERIGDSQEQTADVRIIAATNRDLELEVEKGRFRRDLFDRLNFLPVHIPPLRERREDIPGLLRYCLDRTEPGRRIELPAEVTSHLEHLDYPWPGNVRHIEQLAARLTAERAAGPISVEDVARLLDARAPRPQADAPDDPGAGLPSHNEEAERAYLEEALRRYPDLTREEIASKLRISVSSFYRKLRKYGING